LPLACDLQAIAKHQRAAHEERAVRLISDAVLERQELPNGYTFRYNADDYNELVAFTGNERLCCPFFHFTLEVSPAKGPVWLRITGGQGGKESFGAVLAGEQKLERN